MLSFELIRVSSYIECSVLVSLNFKTAGYFFSKARAGVLKRIRRFLQCASARNELRNKLALQATPLPSLALRIHTRSRLFRPHSPLLRLSVDRCKITDCCAVYRLLSLPSYHTIRGALLEDAAPEMSRAGLLVESDAVIKTLW